MTCIPHNNPDNWVESPAKNPRCKPGTIAVTCRVCKKFIGYRPPKEMKTKGKNKAA